MESAIRSRELEREAHAFGAHRNAVADADSVEAHAHQSGRDHALLGLFGELEKMHVARIAFEPYASDAHLGLVHVLFGEPGGVEHRLGCALRLG